MFLATNETTIFNLPVETIMPIFAVNQNCLSLSFSLFLRNRKVSATVRLAEAKYLEHRWAAMTKARGQQPTELDSARFSA